MSSFFTAPASQKKRKRPDTAANSSSKRRSISAVGKSAPTPPQKKSRKTRDESISDGDSDESGDGNGVRDDYGEEEDGSQSSGGEDETADERRLRLAQRYLDNIRDEVQEDPYAFDAADVDRDLIAERLKEDVAETKGRLHRHIAADFAFSHAQTTFFTADQNGITAVATILPYVFTVSNDGTLAKWELAAPVAKQDDTTKDTPTNFTPRKRPKLVKRFRQPRQPKPSYQGHTSSILCIAASSSGKFLVTGGADRKLVIWDPQTLKPLKCFTHHRDSVLSLSFRRGTHTLYSASADRTCKVWSVDQLAYVQTLFGHQDEVVDIAGLGGEKFVSVGARDRTARLFKVIEEQQLVFRGGGGGGSSSKEKKNQVNGNAIAKYDEGSIDRVAAIDEETFVTGSDNGSLALWSVLRKKPIFTIPLAHGTDAPPSLAEAYAELDPDGVLTESARPGRPKPRWITALRTIPLADIILSGSWDGYVRVWRVTPDRRRLETVSVLGAGSPVSGPSPAIEAGDEAKDEVPQINGTNSTHDVESADLPKPIKGVINEISIAERGEKSMLGASSPSSSLCIVLAVSKAHRLGKWHVQKGAGTKNCAVVFEVPRMVLTANGSAVDDDDAAADEKEAE